MKILGVRTGASEIRYAILEIENQTARFTNANDENMLLYPSNAIEISEKLSWLHSEFERIIRQNPDVSKIVIKTNENGRRDTASIRLGYYAEGVLLSIVGMQNIPIEIKKYTSLGTRSRDVKQFSEDLCGQSQTHWNTKIADAIAAAWSGGE